MTYITLVRLLARVYSKVSLELEGVGTGVGAVDTLVGPLPGVATHMALQFTQLNARVVALGALVGLL